MEMSHSCHLRFIKARSVHLLDNLKLIAKFEECIHPVTQTDGLQCDDAETQNPGAEGKTVKLKRLKVFCYGCVPR